MLVNLRDRIAGFSVSSDVDQFQLHLVRETQGVKVYQSHHALPIVLIVGIVFIFTLWDDAPRVKLIIWISLIFCAAFYRTMICKRIEERLGDADAQELYSNELWLFFTSLLNTSVFGSGFWWICIDGTDRVVFAVTLVCCMYAIGTTINSSVRFNNFPVLIFANLGQGVLFLSGVGRSANLEVSATMIGIALLLIQFGRRNSQVFTESIHIRDKIRKQNIDLERAIDDKSNFLNAASHDMGSPLSAMGIYLESLEKYIPSGKAKKDLEKIYKASEELNDLCNILLDLSKFDAKALEPHFTEFRLDEILNDIVDGVEKDAKIKELTIHLISDAVSIISDKFNIERLIRNLVENAVNYTEKGSIRIETKSAPAGFHLIISDTGPGIAKSEQDKIFDDFYRIHNPARNAGKGRGLGLGIVKRISNLLELDINLQSDLGKGTTFDVFIPNREPSLALQIDTTNADTESYSDHPFSN